MPGTTRSSHANTVSMGRGVSKNQLAATGNAPVRRCAFSLESHGQDELIRFARTPDGLVVPDIAAKLPGRGVWLKPCRQTLEKGLAANLFSRAFKTKTTPVDHLCDEIERQLVDRCVKLLGLARKSGLMIQGFDKVRTHLQSGSLAWLLEASDGADDGRGKVYCLARSLHRNFEIAGALTSFELGMAFGSRRVVHALLKPGPLANSFGIAYRRLTGFRSAPECNWFPGGRGNHHVTSGLISPFRTSRGQRQA